MTVPPRARTRFPRLLLAFLAAAGVAYVGAAFGPLALGARGRPESFGDAVVVLLFGWPFALGAALAAAPVYLVLARLGRVTRGAALGVGAALGFAAGLVLPGDSGLGVWCALVGAAAGRVWWRVAAGAAATG